MTKFAFRWRSKHFVVFDKDNPILKDNIEAKDLDDAWKIWFEKHLLGNTDQMKNLNQIEIIQLKEAV